MIFNKNEFYFKKFENFLLKFMINFNYLTLEMQTDYLIWDGFSTNIYTVKQKVCLFLSETLFNIFLTL